MDLDSLIAALYELDAVKFGEFTLKSGVESPVYFDLRVIVSAPKILDALSEHLYRLAVAKGVVFASSDDDKAGTGDSSLTNVVTQVCGVPYTALPIATCVSSRHGLPMIIRRKEAKTYGTKKMLEGKWKDGEVCLVLEDVVTSGSSVLETVVLLRNHGLRVTHAVAILDREQGGRKKLMEEGVTLHALLTTSTIMATLQKKNLIDELTVERVSQFVSSCQINSPSKPPLSSLNVASKSFKERMRTSDPECLSKDLFALMIRKKTNLCVAIDVADSKRLLEIAAAVGPYVCIVKTHADVVADPADAFIPALRRLADDYEFFLFEDRKFGDIGNTVKAQYTEGPFRIIEWADIVDAHPLPGPDIVSALKEAAEESGKRRGCLLVAEMSSEGNLATPDYAEAAANLADKGRPFIFGLIAQRRPDKDSSDLIIMTPGIKMGGGGDDLGQRYDTPQNAVARGCDVIIVGRGVTGAKDAAKAAAEYKRVAWESYLERVAESLGDKNGE